MNRLKQLREEYGLTQADVGQILGLTSQAYSYYENGKRDISTESLIKLSDFYNVSTDYILKITDIRSCKLNSNLLKINIDMKNYKEPTEFQKKQIEDFAKFVLRDNYKRTKD